MQIRARANRIMKSEAGVSFIFVLGLMVMLMAIGVSAVVAASDNIGLYLSQKAHSQSLLLADSIQRNFMYSLQCEPENPASLSAQLVMALYSAGDSGASLDDIELAMDFDNGFRLEDYGAAVESIVLSFPVQSVFTYDEIPPVYFDEDGDGVDELVYPWEPKSASVDASMSVSVTFTVGDRRMTSIALYQYTGGYLVDSAAAYGDAESMGFLSTDDAGVWELLEYETFGA